ncbi:MAG TPA: ISL3 family transposase, partial [Solirubrobacteraceae bacterium]|nr:ISL3 family transposase [Solirubrobacteraceae bacterium]
MRVTRVFKRLLGLRGERVVGVELVEAPKPRLVVEVALPVRRRLVCGRCGQLCGSVYDHRRQAWRDLDAVTTSVWITCRIARVACPDCGVVAEAVSWARPQARFTRRFEDTCAWLLQQASRRAVAALLGVDWETVGRITSRVVNEQRHRYGDGLDGLRRIGIDEVAYRRGYRYLTVVCCHDTGRVVWVAPGRHRATIERFFGELGPQRSAALEAVSLDLSQSYQQAVRRHAPNAAVCADPFHVAKKALFALDRLRSRHWQRLRRDDPLTA